MMIPQPQRAPGSQTSEGTPTTNSSGLVQCSSDGSSLSLSIGIDIGVSNHRPHPLRYKSSPHGTESTSQQALNAYQLAYAS